MDKIRKFFSIITSPNIFLNTIILFCLVIFTSNAGTEHHFANIGNHSEIRSYIYFRPNFQTKKEKHNSLPLEEIEKINSSCTFANSSFRQERSKINMVEDNQNNQLIKLALTLKEIDKINLEQEKKELLKLFDDLD